MASDGALRVRAIGGRRGRERAPSSARLARRITWAASKQSALIAGLLARGDRRDDCYRAYAYFRWVDDVVDEVAQTRERRLRFVVRQRDLIGRLYRHERPSDLTPEEQMLADLIRDGDDRLRSYLYNFLSIIEFDAVRKGQPIGGADLAWYSERLGMAVTDAIEFFIAADQRYPDVPSRHLAAEAAHITHMLRDLVEDLGAGYLNIPYEYLQAHRIQPSELDSLPMRTWVMDRVALAREKFRAGKRFLESLDDLRSKLAGNWYCTRFELVLDAIERDGYVLRAAYPERKGLKAMLRMVWIGMSVIAQHTTQRLLGVRLAGTRVGASSKLTSS